MASLTKRATSKYWVACFRGRDGRRLKKSTGTTDRRKAQRIADAWEEKHAWRSIQAMKDQARKDIEYIFGEVDEEIPTVREFFETFMAGHRKNSSPSTVLTYQKTVDRFLDHLGGKVDEPIDTILRKDVEAFREKLLDPIGLSPRSAAGSLRILKSAFHEARRKGLITDGTLEEVKPPRVKAKARPPAFTEDQFRTMLAHATGELGSLAVFGAFLGLRLSDIAKLTWEAIDLEKNEIRLDTKKTGKPVAIPIHEDLREHILSLPSTDDPTDPVHPEALSKIKRTKSGKASTLSREFGDLLIRAGLRNKKKAGTKRRAVGLSFHSLRRMTATLLHEAGTPMAVAREIVGHDSVEIHELYLRPGPKAKEKAVKAFPSLLKPEPDSSGE